MNEIEKIIQERIKKLPPKVALAIAHVSWLNKIKDIAQSNNLSEEKSRAFEVETVLLVLGMESLSKYPNNLTGNVGLSDDLTIKIATEVDEQIITPIKQYELLEKDNQISKEELSKEKTPEIPTQPKVFEPKIETPITTPASKTTTVEIPPANLPMIEPGEVVHDTTPKVSEARIMNHELGGKDIEVGTKNQEASDTNTNTKSAYEGADPYREPLG